MRRPLPLHPDKLKWAGTNCKGWSRPVSAPDKNVPYNP